MATNEIHNVSLVLKVEGEADLMRLVKAVNDQNAILKSSAAQFERNSLSMRGFGRSAMEAAASFQKGSGGIAAWTDSLNRNKAGVASWVAAMGNVDSVNRKFAGSLQGSSGGISNWVNELGKVNNGVSNWVRAMGQIGSSATQAATTLAQVKAELSSWNTSMLAGGKASGDWVARMGAVDAANRSATQGFKTGTYVVRDMAAAMGKSASYVEIMKAANEKAATAAKKLQQAHGSTGFIVRNASSQFQDFAVQIQGGQDAMRAFAQQFPQLASAFGSFGTVLGTIVAITIALPALKAAWDAFMGSAETGRGVAERLSKSLNDWKSAISSVDDVIKVFNADSMIEALAKLDEKTRGLAMQQIELQKQLLKTKQITAAADAGAKLQELATPQVMKATGVLDFLNRSFNKLTDGFTNAEKGIEIQARLGLDPKEFSAAIQLMNELKTETSASNEQLQKLNDLAAKALKKGTAEAREFAEQLNDTAKTAFEARSAFEKIGKAQAQVAKGDFTTSKESLKEMNKDAQNLARILAGLRYAENSTIGYKSSATSPTGAKGTYQITGGFRQDAEKLLGYKIDPRNDKQAEAAVSVMINKYMEMFDGNVAKALLAFSGVGVGGVKAAEKLAERAGTPDQWLKFAQMQHPEANVSPAKYLERAARGMKLFDDKTGKVGLEQTLADFNKQNKEIEDAERKHQQVLASIRVDQSGKGLSDVQQKMAEARMQAYKQEGIDLDNLTEAMKRNKAEIDAAVQAKFMGIEVDKLQQRQTELAKKALEDMNDVLSGSVDIDIYNSKLADLQDALKGGAISTEDFIMWTGKLTEEFNKTNDPIKQYTASLLQQQDALADIPQRIAAVQELMSKGLLNEKVGEDEILNLRQMTGEMDSLGSRTVDFFEGQLSGSINTFVDAIHGAKFSFKDFVDNMVKDITKFLLQEQLTAWMKSLRAGGAAGDAQSWWETLPGLFGLGGGSGGSSAPATFNGTGPLMSFAGSGGGGGSGGFGGITDAILKGFSMFASFDVGTPYVKKDMFAKIHKGEMIIPASQVKNMNNNYGGHTVNQSIIIQGNANDPERLKRSIGEGARNALASFNTAKRYA